jgi:hypothetical protein
MLSTVGQMNEDTSVARDTVAVVGAGWYGTHIALSLAKKGFDVSLYDKHPEIVSGVSGTFGLRVHCGPHYPRSERTRAACQAQFGPFADSYSSLLYEVNDSFYILGSRDADDFPSKIDLPTFQKVCEEFRSAGALDNAEASRLGFNTKDILCMYRVRELWAPVGEKLRCHLMGLVDRLGVKFFGGSEVFCDDGHCVRHGTTSRLESFHHVISATGLFSTPLPFGLRLVYQVCLGFLYESRTAGTGASALLSFIVMDGWFPCLMPYVGSGPPRHLLYHGKHAIYSTHADPESAWASLQRAHAHPADVETRRQASEDDASRFWPKFGDTFKYVGWEGGVLPKLISATEFRSAVTWKDASGVIRLVCGKVSEVGAVAAEVEKLIAGGTDTEVTAEVCAFVRGGALSASLEEIAKPVDDPSRTTAYLYKKS